MNLFGLNKLIEGKASLLGSLKLQLYISPQFVYCMRKGANLQFNLMLLLAFYHSTDEAEAATVSKCDFTTLDSL